jgi:hypothetical protein
LEVLALAIPQRQMQNPRKSWYYEPLYTAISPVRLKILKNIAVKTATLNLKRVPQFIV